MDTTGSERKTKHALRAQTDNNRNQKRRRIQDKGSHETEIMKRFKLLAEQYDAINDRLERLVKTSRDITIEISAKVAAPLAAIRVNISKIISELQGQPYYQYHRAFSPGIQEYIESVSFLHFLQTGELITLQQIERDILDAHSVKGDTFFVAPSDYLLGICDLTGEVMRLCVNAVAAGEHTICHKVLLFLRQIYQYMNHLPSLIEGLSMKLDVMKTSLDKVENINFQLKVREEEYPKELIVTLFGEPMQIEATRTEDEEQEGE